MTNMLLKDDLYEVVDIELEYVVIKLVAQATIAKTSSKRSNFLWHVIVTIPRKLEEKDTTLSYLLRDATKL